MAQKTHSRSVRPYQSWETNQKTAPLIHRNTMRMDDIRVATSGFAGKMLPIAAVPLLREDGIRSSRVRVSFDMAETADMLMNAVEVVVRAYVVPKLAFERFNGMDSLNRSYKQIAETDGSVIPWFKKLNYESGSEPRDLFKTMGIHTDLSVTTPSLNSDYYEAYNVIWNYLAKMRSPTIKQRAWNEIALAPAFWSHSFMKHVKPDFDQAMIDGEVDLNLVGNLPVRGLGIIQGAASEGPATVNETGLEGTGGTAWENHVKGSTGNAVGVKANEALYPEVYAELAQTVGTISLSNINLARQTAAFARMRADYQGLDDDHLIDLLMSGIRIPEEQLKRPLLLDMQRTIFGMSQRYATDSANLEKSVVQGQTYVDLNLNLPPLNTGGVVMITAEILPEQIFERQEDFYLTADTPDQMPERIRDELDPEPVEVVNNSYVDAAHSDPDGIFGYAPLNHRWQRQMVRLGGKFLRTDPSAEWDENRNRIWAVETVDPTLTTDFYLSENIHHNVFEDSLSDPFEIMAVGRVNITGKTYFGPALREATDHYDKIWDQVDHGRIKKPGNQEPLQVLQSGEETGDEADEQEAKTTKTTKKGEKE